MRRTRIASILGPWLLMALVLAAASACSSLDGLSGGSPDGSSDAGTHPESGGDSVPDAYVADVVDADAIDVADTADAGGMPDATDAADATGVADVVGSKDGTVTADGPATADVAAPVPIRFVQSSSTVSLSVPTMRLSSSFPGPVTAGNLVVVGVQFDTPIVSVSDGATSYALATSAGMLAIYYGVVDPMSSGQVTVSFSGAASGVLAIQEYAGVSPPVVLDQTGGSTGMGTAVTSGPVTTMAPHELLFAFARADSGIVMIPTPGFQMRETAAGNLSEDRVVTSINTYSATFTAAMPSNWAAVIATFEGIGP